MWDSPLEEVQNYIVTQEPKYLFNLCWTLCSHVAVYPDLSSDFIDYIMIITSKYDGQNYKNMTSINLNIPLMIACSNIIPLRWIKKLLKRRLKKWFNSTTWKPSSEVKFVADGQEEGERGYIVYNAIQRFRASF